MKDIKILSIDGGGSRGIIPATILSFLEADIQARYPEKSIADYFDLVAGTSTGGIITLAISARLKMSDIAALYQHESKNIFEDVFMDKYGLDIDKYLFNADYSQDYLNNFLKRDNLFGDKSLKDLKKYPYIMICSFDICPDEPSSDTGFDPTQPMYNFNFRPEVFNNFYKKFENEKLHDLSCRTSAGPTYFPIYDGRYIDGGVSMNNPAMAAIAFAINNSKDEFSEMYGGPDQTEKGLFYRFTLENKIEDKKALDELKPHLLNKIKLLSIGTGTSNRNRIALATGDDGNWGGIRWLKHLPNMLVEANIQSTNYYVKQLLPADNYVRINFDLGFNGTGTPIPMDTKDEELIRKMIDVATSYYHQHKLKFFKFLEIQ